MEKFDYLGTLQEWLSKEYSNHNIIVLDQDLNNKNIPVFIITAEDVELKILCTQILSDDIRNGKRSINQLNDNIIIKVSNEDGNSFYRISHLVYGMTI